MKMNLPPFIEIYRALIATPSISATEEALDQSNESLINLLAGWFSDLGFNVEVQPVPGTRHKFNLLASTGTGAGGLLLAGHTDTVPFDDGRWTRDPFTLTEHDNKLYGLGTADMKGFFAFILDALRDVVRVDEQRGAGAERGDLGGEGLLLVVVQERERVGGRADRGEPVPACRLEVRRPDEACDDGGARRPDRGLLVRTAGAHLETGPVAGGGGHARCGGCDG